MASLSTFKCPEGDCNVTMIGQGEDATELTEFMSLCHNKYSKHRKNFEHTDLGRLPPEILIKILGYVVQDCKKCYHQRYRLGVGSVCKKLNQLAKEAYLIVLKRRFIRQGILR